MCVNWGDEEHKGGETSRCGRLWTHSASVCVRVCVSRGRKLIVKKTETAQDESEYHFPLTRKVTTCGRLSSPWRKSGRAHTHKHAPTYRHVFQQTGDGGNYVITKTRPVAFPCPSSRASKSCRTRENSHLGGGNVFARGGGNNGCTCV